jgi:acyl-CoA thioester hydrolase
MGVVYHSNHLVYFEVGRTELMRKRGIRYADLEAEGYALAVTEAHARFSGKVTYDDEIAVSTSLALEGKSRVRFDYQIRIAGEDKPVSTGYTLHVFIGPDGAVTRIPEKVKQAVAASE